MASLSDLPLKHRIFLRMYRYRRVDWTPGAVLSRPLSAARVAAITSAGYYLPDQPPFDDAIRGGDSSFRVIPDGSTLDYLRIAQRSEAFDRKGIEADKNLALPLDRLHELVEANVIGSVAPRHVSLMGSITAPGRLVAETAPALVAMLRQDEVHAVLLTPV